MSSGWLPKHRQLFFQIFQEGPKERENAFFLMTMMAKLTARLWQLDRRSQYSVMILIRSKISSNPRPTPSIVVKPGT